MYLSLLAYSIAYYYILLSAINDGFSSFLLGIPYAAFLFWEISTRGLAKPIKYMHISILVLALSFITMDRGASKFFYPIVDEEITIVNDVNFSYNTMCWNCIGFNPQYRDDHNKIFTFKKGDVITVTKQIHLGHNVVLDLGYRYQISSKRLQEVKKYMQENLEEVKSKAIKNMRKKYISEEEPHDVNLYIDDSNAFYTDDMFALLRSQKLLLDRYPRFHSNYFIYFSFYILVYPVILALFIMLLWLRNKTAISKT